MSQELPSLKLMLDRQERVLDQMRGSVEAIDRKATVMVVGSGVLVGLSPETPTVWLVPALLSVLVAGGLAVATLWPRDFPALIPHRKHLANPEDQTERVLYATYESLIKQADEMMTVKARLLRRSVVGFLLAAVFFAVGVVWQGAEGGDMSGNETPDQPPEEEPETPSVSLPEPDPEMMGHIVEGEPPDVERLESDPPEGEVSDEGG